MEHQALTLQDLRKGLDAPVAEAVSNFTHRIREADQLTDQLLESTSEVIQQEMMQMLLSPEFLRKLVSSDALTGSYQKRLSFEFRTLCTPLSVPFPEPVLEIRARSWAYAGCLGAILGLLAGGPIGHYLLDMRDVGLVVGGPAGAFLFLLALGYLVQHPRVLRMVQAAFGAATVLEIASMATSSVNPLSILWRSVTKHITGRGIFSRFKRIGAYLAGILVLQLAVPKPRARWDQLERNVRESIRSWLTMHLNILRLLVQSDRKDAGPCPEMSGDALDPNLLKAIQKLVASPDARRNDAALEVVQEFKNAGYASSEPQAENIQFDSILLEKYDVLGLIEPGDPVKILESPVIRNKQIVKKGKLTKERQTP